VAQPSSHPAWLADLLAEGDVYEVGGSVRDSLLAAQRGEDPPAKDRDFLIRRIGIDRLQEILGRHGAVNLVGRFFGVIKFTPRGTGETYDLSLPRLEKSYGAGHTDFHVDFDPELPVERDLGRRDFTINAIARDLRTGALIDVFKGQADLEARQLRMVFPTAFIEDPLRMLRGVQFAARFDLTIEPATFNAIRDSADLIQTVSPERAAEELNKLLELAKRPSRGFLLMQELGLLKYILPELEATVGVTQPGPYHVWPVFEHTLVCIDAAPPRLNVRWACLLHDINKPQCRVVEEDRATFYGHDKMGARTAKRVLQRLRYSNDFIDQVTTLVDKHMFTTQVTDKGMRRLVRRVGTDLIFDLLDLRRADVYAQGKGGSTDDVDELEARIRAEIDKKSPFGLKDLAVNGSDLIGELGMTPGPEIGRILNQLLEVVLDDPAQNTRETLLAEARKLLSAKM
jgi:putative nucleotidyltransferase with HDIG domain